MMKLECVGCGGGAPLGIWLIIYFYILLCAFVYRQCANDVQMTKMICVGCARCVGVYGGVQMMKMECAGCGGSAPLGIWLIIYFHVHLYAFVYRQCANDVQMMKSWGVECVRRVRCGIDENGVYGIWWRCAPRDLFLYVILCTSNEQMMKNGVCGGWEEMLFMSICSFMCEGWSGALRDLFIYVFYCWWVYFMCWWCVQVGVHRNVRGLEGRP